MHRCGPELFANQITEESFTSLPRASLPRASLTPCQPHPVPVSLSASLTQCQSLRKVVAGTTSFAAGHHADVNLATCAIWFWQTATERAIVQLVGCLP